MSTSISDTEVGVFIALCDNLGTPVAYKASLLAARGDWVGLSRLRVRPADYTCPETYLADCQAVSFFKKYPGFDLGVDRKQVAVDNFWVSERQCFQANERISPLLFDLGHYGSRLSRFVREWRKEVKSVLGRAPSRSSLDGRFGPGSTFMNVGDKVTLADKLTDDYTATRSARSFLHVWDMTAWSRYAACGLDADTGGSFHRDQYEVDRPIEDPHAIRDFTYIRGNRFTTVLKDSEKDRGICVEPSLNVFYQLALGRAISSRMLTKYGWDKSTCESFHKTLARIGSLTGSVATIDLSNASDTVCYNLIKLLLPPDWWQLVADLRSSHTLLNGKWVKLEKFSSMGNGFTFELETLVFFTMAKVLNRLEPSTEEACTPGLAISVYGDDIIVPTSNSASMVAALKFFGFTPNEKKTFLEGPFRESCGGDYFAGHDVRPHFQKEVCEEPHHLIALANGLRRLGRRLDDLGSGVNHRVAWFRCLDAIPRQIRICRGPEELGDLVIHDEAQHWIKRNPIRVRNSIRYLRVWRPVANPLKDWCHYRPGVVLSVALYGGSSGSSPTPLPNADLFRRSGIVPRLQGVYVAGYRFGREVRA